MRKILHKAKSQWVVLGVMGATVVSFGTATVQQVSAAEVDGVVATVPTVLTVLTEQSGDSFEPKELDAVSSKETVIEEVPYVTVEIADSNIEEDKTELTSTVTSISTDEIIAVGTKDVTESVIEVSSPTVSEASATEGETNLSTAATVTATPTDEIITVEANDVTAPVIDVSSVKISQTSAVPGDTITFSANITDDVGVRGGTAYYQLPNGETYKKLVDLYKNEINGLYEGTITVDDSTKSGNWNIISISAYDAVGNRALYSNHNVDLSAATFSVKGNNPESYQLPAHTPVLDPSSVKVSQASAVSGETITLSANITNAQKGIAYYEAPFGDSFFGTTVYLNKNEESGLYEGTIDIYNTMRSGDWILKSITAYTNSKILTHYFSYNVDLSAADFTVTGTADGNVNIGSPVIDLSSIRVSQSSAVIGETVTVYANIKDTGMAAVFYHPESEFNYYLDWPKPEEYRMSGKMVPLYRNNITGLLEGTIPITEGFKWGNWILTGISAVDFSQQRTTISTMDPIFNHADLSETHNPPFFTDFYSRYNVDLSVANFVVHISKTEMSETTELIPHTTEKSDDATLPIGETEIIQSGVDGIRKYTYAVTFSDGVEKKRELINTTTVTAPINEIIKVGTQPMNTKNVAIGATVSTSANSDTSAYTALERRAAFRGEKITAANFDRTAYIADGQTTTINNYTNGIPGLQKIQMDLGAAYDLNAIRLWHYYGDGRSYRDVVVQLSNDATFTDGVATVFNNDKDGSAGFDVGVDSEYSETIDGKVIAFATTNARYVRFYSNGSNVNDWNHYVEIKVYGTEVSEPPIEQPAATNVAISATLTTSANFDRTSYIADGQTTTINNYANGIPGLQLVQMDLGAAYDLNAIQLWHYYADARSYRDVVVQLSNDATFTDGVATVFNNDKDGSSGLGVGAHKEYSETSVGKSMAFTTTNARYVRFYSNGSNVNGWNHYIEIKVYGSDRKSVIDGSAPINA